MSTSCSSTSVESTHSASITVRSVFSCVASRKREAAGPRDEASRSPSGPNPLGENITLSSPPLKPRGLLLSVMRQKVSKERSQGDCHPLGHPPRLGSESPTEKIRPCAHTLEAVQNPGWSAQRHRKGRRPEGRNYPRPKLDLMPSPSYCRLVETGGRTPPPREARTASFTASLYPKRPLPGDRPKLSYTFLRTGRPAETPRAPTRGGASRGAAAGPSDPTGRNCST